MVSKANQSQQLRKRNEISLNLPYIITDTRLTMTRVARKIASELEEVEERLREAFKENLDE